MASTPSLIVLDHSVCAVPHSLALSLSLLVKKLATFYEVMDYFPTVYLSQQHLRFLSFFSPQTLCLNLRARGYKCAGRKTGCGRQFTQPLFFSLAERRPALTSSSQIPAFSVPSATCPTSSLIVQKAAPTADSLHRLVSQTLFSRDGTTLGHLA